MRTQIVRIFRNLNQLSYGNPLNKAQTFNKSTQFHIRRTYKNFGHARQKEPLGTVVWVAFLVFVMCIGSLRCVQ